MRAFRYMHVWRMEADVRIEPGRGHHGYVRGMCVLYEALGRHYYLCRHWMGETVPMARERRDVTARNRIRGREPWTSSIPVPGCLSFRSGSILDCLSTYPMTPR